MHSSPACWAAYGQVLEREYSDAVLFGHAHRLTVDAFAVMHPGDPSERRAVQSFWIHGASLWIVLRLGHSHVRATQALKALAGGEFPERPEEHSRFAMTHSELLYAPIENHVKLAREWADAALAGWSDAHRNFEALAHRALA